MLTGDIEADDYRTIRSETEGKINRAEAKLTATVSPSINIEPLLDMATVLKNYYAASKHCKACPMKSTCVPNIPCRKITRTIYDEQYLRAYSRQKSKRGIQMKKLRQSTVEPVFGSLTQYYGLRKIGVLGKAGAHKVMLMAAIDFNLKKYLKKAFPGLL